MLSSANESNVATSALHANAAWQQGVLAALLAVLDFGAGGDVLDTEGNVLVSAKHVQLAWRLVEVSLGIREAWRGLLQPQHVGEEDLRACVALCCVVLSSATYKCLLTELPGLRRGSGPAFAPPRPTCGWLWISCKHTAPAGWSASPWASRHCAHIDGSNSGTSRCFFCRGLRACRR